LVTGRHGARIDRVLSKLGACSRAEAARLVAAGRIRINGRVCTDPSSPADPSCDRIEIDGRPAVAAAPAYVVLNKPRGLVTTTSDERGRPTVYECFGPDAPARLVPVGRLDQASEGLLLFTTDTAWADAVTNPARRVDKVYHVQVNRPPTEPLARSFEAGAQDGGEHLAARRAAVLRAGEKNGWLEITLDEGRNRHIRRLASALGLDVLRLIRVAVGPLQLGNLAKGAWRHLERTEVESIARAAGLIRRGS
jgi:23S rRNA pseudouridine2605 synthase